MSAAHCSVSAGISSARRASSWAAALGRRPAAQPSDQPSRRAVQAYRSPSRLARFQADHARYHAAIDLATDALDAARADVSRMCDQDVAGRGADHLDQRVGARPGADRAHVAVERAAADDDIGREAEPLGPLGAQAADRHVGGLAGGEERAVEVAHQQRIERGEELGRRQAAPLGMPERLVSRRAAPARQLRRCAATSQQRRHPVAQLDPAAGGFAHRRIGTADVQDLGPEPLARIDATGVAGVIGEAAAVREPVQRLGLLDGGVVLPEHEHRVRVVGELRKQRQHAALGVDRRGR
jgi:hypothetical protein